MNPRHRVLETRVLPLNYTCTLQPPVRLQVGIKPDLLTITPCSPVLLCYSTLSGVVKNWSGREDSNFRPLVPKTSALPGCATPRLNLLFNIDSKTFTVNFYFGAGNENQTRSVQGLEGPVHIICLPAMLVRVVGLESTASAFRVRHSTS